MPITPVSVLRVSTFATLLGMALILVYRALTGRLPLRGLLTEAATERRSSGAYSPTRAQLLVVANLCAMGLVADLARGPSGDRGLGVLLALALTTSNLIYLRKKIRELGAPRWLSRR